MSSPRPRPAIRWDRVGRVALLLVLAGVIMLYVNPLRDWWSTMNEAEARRGEVERLRHEHRALEAQRDALRDPAALEREARRLGMVRRGERPYVVNTGR